MSSAIDKNSPYHAVKFAPASFHGLISLETTSGCLSTIFHLLQRGGDGHDSSKNDKPSPYLHYYRGCLYTDAEGGDSPPRHRLPDGLKEIPMCVGLRSMKRF
jgi:hypothetical protein